MSLDHGVAQNGIIHEVGSVIHQHTSICGRKYVVGEYLVKNLDNRPTLLLWLLVWLVDELPAQVLNHFAFLLQGEVVNGISE